MKYSSKSILIFCLIVLIISLPIIFGTAKGEDGGTGANDVEVTLDLDNYKETEEGEEWKIYMQVDICRPEGSSVVSINSLELKSAPAGSNSWKRIVEEKDIDKDVKNGTCLNYEVTIDIPKSWGCIKVEATASTSAGEGSGNEGSDIWIGSAQGGTGNYHSSLPGNLNFSSDVDKAKASGFYSSDTKNVTICACGSDMTLNVDGPNAELIHEEKSNEKLLSKWTFWKNIDSSEGSTVNLPDYPPVTAEDSGWIDAKNLSKSITIPQGWVGDIKFKTIVRRDGLDNRAGEYSGSVDLEITE